MSAAKLAGCACLAVASGIWCFCYVSSLRARLEALERSRRFALFVGEQIRDYQTPYPTIVARFAASEGLAGAPGVKRGDEGAGDVPGESVFGSGAGAAGDLSPIAFSRIGAELAAHLDEGDGRRFLSFYNGIGAGSAETELRLCDEAGRYFGDKISEKKEEYSKKKRAGVALALFALFSVCVLVW